jgi:hypothetical protein
MPKLTTFHYGPSCRIACAKPNPDKITLGTITLSLNKLPIYVAQDKGFSPVRISSCNH